MSNKIILIIHLFGPVLAIIVAYALRSISA